jgi:hypothetical protein
VWHKARLLMLGFEFHASLGLSMPMPWLVGRLMIPPVISPFLYECIFPPPSFDVLGSSG